ncbi:hypothetical protein F2Q70_00016660 [Brassica cretica]|uniref:Uncharacterized protein n=1 Tax=Brassica cretica TaxID=69181 RepID=A0A8S9KYD8_BRACR|nr:hypothetical protein F2Q70_00016660 [Brassica cretica]KAF2598166.1 hypothetical protein F2Q68_00009629 [Brassica cretica]
MGRSSLPLNFHETASPHTLAFKAALAIESEVRSSPFFPHHLRVFPGSIGGFGVWEEALACLQSHRTILRVGTGIHTVDFNE